MSDKDHKVRLELLDGTVEVTGSEDFVRKAQALFVHLATDVPIMSGAIVQEHTNRLEQPHQDATTPPDIRTLRDQKQPRNQVEMAALVAYYLTHLIPPPERKETINASDITKYFGQALYTMTTQPRMVLFKTKAAGYFDSPSHGEFKLNPVGYNLVTAGLPADQANARRHRNPPTRRTAKRKK